jgi:hypothetical protein
VNVFRRFGRRPTARGIRLGVLPVALTALLLGTSQVQAKDISYTYLDGTYQSIDPDFGSSDTGYRLEGSLGLLLGFYGFARWESADIDDLDGDLSAGDLGLGWHLGLGDTVHGLVEVAYTDRELGPLDSDGYTVSVGVRFAPVERWEFGVKAGYRDLDRNLDGGYGEGYALWKVWSVVGLTARAEIAEDANRIGIGARISF